MSGLDLGAGIITLSISTGTIITIIKILITKLRKRQKFKEREVYIDKKLKKFWIRKISLEIEGLSKSIKTIAELSLLTEIITKALIEFTIKEVVK